ncbi:MAG: MFS transporter [Lachnospiraceae bacterium]|nr:MFS transporter [Lachnospiraceae bacterium]
MLTEKIIKDKSIISLYVCKFLIAFSNFVVTYLTFYLVNYKKMSPQSAGIIITIVAFSYVPATLIGGKISFVGIREKLAFFFLISGCCYVIVPVISTLYFQLLCIVMGKIFLTITEPMIMGILNNRANDVREKKNIFSSIYLFTNLGFALGPLVAGSIYTRNIYLIFVFDGVLKILVAVIIYLFFVEDVRLNESTRVKHEYLKVINGSPTLLIFAVLVMVINWIYFQTDFSLPILFEKLYGAGGVKFYSFVMTTNALVIIVGTKLVNRITIDFKSYSSVIIAGVLFSFAYAGYALFSNMILFVFMTAIWSIGEILFYTNYTICINEIVGERFFSEAYALINSISRIISILNPMIIGFVLKIANIQNILMFLSLTMMFVTIMYIPLRKKIYEYS